MRQVLETLRRPPLPAYFPPKHCKQCKILDLQVLQIHFPIWTNTIWNLGESFELILLQNTDFTSFINTFWIWTNIISKLGNKFFSSPNTFIQLHCFPTILCLFADKYILQVLKRSAEKCPLTPWTNLVFGNIREISKSIRHSTT